MISTATSCTAAASFSDAARKPRPELRISEDHWRDIRRALDGSFRSECGEERGIVALLGENLSTTRPGFTVAQIVQPEPDDVRSTPFGLTFSSRYLRRSHVEMRRCELAALATFHTHPFSDTHVAFSQSVDDVEDPKLIANLCDIDPRTKLISIVLGRRSQAGRLWCSPSDLVSLSRLVVVGERLQVLQLDGSAPPPAPQIEAAFDAGSALTPSGAIQSLSKMTIAIVGVSGIGSLIVELLIRAGARRLLLIDDDVIALRNLNRVLHARHRDIGRVKIHALSEAFSDSGFDIELIAIRGNILDRRVLAQIRDADFLFGCVDRDWPRDLLGQFAFRYLIPYLDLGSEIGTDEDHSAVMSLDARVSYIAPNRACLRCAGIVQARRLSFESLAKDERDRVIAQGYSDDLILSQPAVMDLNMRAASLGSLVLRHLLQPFLLTPLPVALLENVVTYTMRTIMNPRAENPRCPICRVNPFLGAADCAAALGLDETALARITGTRPDPTDHASL